MPHTHTVADVMSGCPTALHPEAPIVEAIKVLLDENASSAPVLRGKAVVGVLSERDCLKVLFGDLYHSSQSAKVADLMSDPVKTVAPSASLLDVAEAFLQTGFRRFPVVADRAELVGMVGRHDVLRAIREEHIDVPPTATEVSWLEHQTRRGSMVTEAKEARDVVGPETNKRFQ